MASMAASIPMRIKVIVRPHGALWRLKLVAPLIWMSKLISGCEFAISGKSESTKGHVGLGEVGEIFQRLYESEINYQLWCFFDEGYDVALGDDTNGVTSSTNGEYKIEDVAEWLGYRAVAQYPDSDFAQWWESREPAEGAK